jgi:hypothetical protein
MGIKEQQVHTWQPCPEHPTAVGLGDLDTASRLAPA